MKEFPDLVALSRRLHSRDFELITISMDDPKDEAKVLRFLQDQHVALPAKTRRTVETEGRRTNNYLFSGSQADDLIRALDPAWPGPLPHTVAIAPGGKVLYRHNGELDGADLTKRILEILGPYYK